MPKDSNSTFGLHCQHPPSDMSPRCDPSSRRKALWPSCGESQPGSFQETSEPRPKRHPVVASLSQNARQGARAGRLYLGLDLVEQLAWTSPGARRNEPLRLELVLGPGHQSQRAVTDFLSG